MLALVWLGLPAAWFATAPGAAAGEIRAAYFYHYMDPDHLDSLASAGFNRALVRLVADSLDPGQRTRLAAFAERGEALGIEIVPDFLVQSEPRLASRGERRYVWGLGTREPRMACPMDTAYWRSALLDRVDEILAATPGCRSVAIDLEHYRASRPHWTVACRCRECRGEFAARRGADRRSAAEDLAGLEAWQERALSTRLAALLGRLAARHPDLEIGVLDLDRDTFVHRALARAIDRSGIPVTDYTERTYDEGGRMLAAARRQLDRLGLREARIVGGLWLKRWPPGRLGAGVRSVTDRAAGYFVFTTYSLWKEPSGLTGPYTLQGAPAEYWRALREVNRTP